MKWLITYGHQSNVYCTIMYSFLPCEDVKRGGERKQVAYRDAPVSINDEAVQGRCWVILRVGAGIFVIVRMR